MTSDDTKKPFLTLHETISLVAFETVSEEGWKEWERAQGMEHPEGKPEPKVSAVEKKHIQEATAKRTSDAMYRIEQAAQAGQIVVLGRRYREDGSGRLENDHIVIPDSNWLSRTLDLLGEDGTGSLRRRALDDWDDYLGASQDDQDAWYDLRFSTEQVQELVGGIAVSGEKSASLNKSQKEAGNQSTPPEAKSLSLQEGRRRDINKRHERWWERGCALRQAAPTATKVSIARTIAREELGLKHDDRDTEEVSSRIETMIETIRSRLTKMEHERGRLSDQSEK